MNISSKNSNSNFVHSFYFHCLNNFAKKYQFAVDGLSLVRVIMLTVNLHLEE